jgi:hypothetical protein
LTDVAQNEIIVLHMKKKNYVHARIGEKERKMLMELKKVTAENESALVKKGLELLYEKEVQRPRSGLEVAGDLVGKYCSEYTDLSTNEKYLEDYGK